MIARLCAVALVAGLAGGLLVTIAQAVSVWPMIEAAEAYEHAAAAPGPAEWAPADGFERAAVTLLANLLIGIGFALLLSAGYAFRGGVDWRRGVLWGLGGFAAFALAPSFGLPPELPGAAAGAVELRQLWWLATAAGTATGLSLLVFARRRAWKALGAALIAAPHLVGAPHADGAGAAPAELAAAFVGASIATSLLFWLVLGVVSAVAFNRLVAPAPARA